MLLKIGKLVKGGKGDCVIYKIKVMNTKTVFVVWNKFFGLCCNCSYW